MFATPAWGHFTAELVIALVKISVGVRIGCFFRMSAEPVVTHLGAASHRCLLETRRIVWSPKLFNLFCQQRLNVGFIS